MVILDCVLGNKTNNGLLFWCFGTHFVYLELSTLNGPYSNISVIVSTENCASNALVFVVATLFLSGIYSLFPHLLLVFSSFDDKYIYYRLFARTEKVNRSMCETQNVLYAFNKCMCMIYIL